MSQRFIALVALAGLIGFAPSAPCAEPGAMLSRDITSLAVPVARSPVPDSVWVLGIAVIGVAVVIRRRAA